MTTQPELPTASEAAARVLDGYGQSVIAEMERLILAAIDKKRLRTHINVQLGEDFDRSELFFLQRAIDAHFATKKYVITDLSIGTFVNSAGQAMHGTMGMTCYVSWFPQ